MLRYMNVAVVHAENCGLPPQRRAKNMSDCHSAAAKRVELFGT